MVPRALLVAECEGSVEEAVSATQSRIAHKQSEGIRCE